MTKRGAEGLRIVGEQRLHLEKVARGDYQVWPHTSDGGLGPRLGRVTRERHTVRTAYAGSRLGYDHTHWCWHTVPRPDRGVRSEWCGTTLQQALRWLL